MANINSVKVNSNAAQEALAAKRAEAKEAAAEKTSAAAEKTDSVSAVVKSDSVQISEKATALASTAKADTTTHAAAAQDTATPAAQSEAKVEATTQQNSAVEKATTSDQPKDIRDVIKEKKAEIRQLKRDLRDIGAGRREIRGIVKDAKKEASSSVKNDLKDLVKDYRSHKIGRKEMKDAVYGIAAKKLDKIVSSMKDAYNQKMGSINNNNETTQAPRESIFTKKADKPGIVEESVSKNKKKSEEAKAAAANEEKTKMEAKPAIKAEPKITEKAEVKIDDDDDDDDDDKKVNAEKATPPGLEKKEEVPPGQEVKAEKIEEAEEGSGASKLEKALKAILKEILKSEKEAPGLANKSEGPGNSENTFDKISGMFDEIEKMVNELDEEDEGADEKSDIGNFVNGLKDMFSSGNGVEGNSFLKGLSKGADEDSGSGAQIKAETLSGLLKGGNANSAFGINRVGDNGEGSGNFTAVNFMSDMSNNASEGLDSYKDAKEAREAAAENQAQQAGAEAQLSEVA